MAIQQGRDVTVGFITQAVLGTEEPAGGGGTKLLYKDGSPLFSPPQAALIESAINLGDGLTERGRRGTYNVPGTLNLEAICGAHKLIYETFFRNTWTSAVTITQATGAMSSATLSVSGSVITFSAGSVITAGLRVGDVIKFASGLDAADNGDWLRVRAVTATTITVYESLTAVAGPVNTYSFTIPPKLLQGTTARLLTFDQYYSTIDRSLVVSDVKGNSLNFQLSENTTLDVTANMLGAGYAYKAAGGTSPHLTNLTTPTGDALTFIDACFAFNGADSVKVTGFNIGLDVAAQTLGVANKTGKSPDVFQGNGKPSGQFSVAMEDFALLTAAAGETQIDFVATFLDPNDTDVFQIAVENAILTQEAITPVQDGAAIQTFNLEIGRDKRGGAYDATSIKLLDSRAT